MLRTSIPLSRCGATSNPRNWRTSVPTPSGKCRKPPNMAWTASAATPHFASHFSATPVCAYDSPQPAIARRSLMVGDGLAFRGPIGGYFVWSTDMGGPLLLVAGGSGICPLMAMLRHRAARQSHVPTRLLYSSRSLDDVIYRKELDSLAGRADGLEVFHTLTRSQPAGWSGYSRRIDRDMLAEVAFAPTQEPLCMVCGPTPLVEAVATTLVELGHAPDRVKTERFGPTGG